MTSSVIIKPDPKLDLVLERVVDVPRELVWEAWTKPEHVKEWFVPRPWTIGECEIDLRPGGVFRTVMCSPEGERFLNTGCYLEVVENERLVWTDALQPGFRPSSGATPASASCHLDGFFTGVLQLESQGSKTRYVAMALHPHEAGKKKHEELGFYEGWGTVLEQLVEYVGGWRN